MTRILLVFTSIFLIAACSAGAQNIPAADEPCVVGGCSSQLCLSKSQAENTMSTCEWTDAYACYGKFSTCGKQPDGTCGWEKNAALLQCIDAATGRLKPPFAPLRENP